MIKQPILSGENYYCIDCKDILCKKCIDFPWECPETKTCKSCLKELETAKTLWVKHKQGKITL